MGVIVSGGQSETFTLDDQGSLTSDINVNIGLPSVINELAINGLTMSELESSLGGGFAYGTGPIGIEGGATYAPGSDEFSLNLNVAYSFLGGEISVTGTYNPETGYVHVSEFEGFAGANAILGEQGELLGITIGNVGSIQAGIFFESTPEGGVSSFPGARVSYSHGLILGSVEGVSTWNATEAINSLSDLSIEAAVQIFSALYPTDSNALLRASALDTFLKRAGFEGSCFGAEVPIDMWPLDPTLKPGPDGVYDQDEVRAKVWKKPIELIEVGDIVVSFDDNDNLVPGPVTRTFQNDAKILLDFHGTRVTPGHVYYRPDSRKSYKYETLIDVLRDDGVIKHQDGTLIRAATNVSVGSPRDGFVQAVTQTRKADGTFEQSDTGRIRLGTRFLVGSGKERKSWAVADLIEAGGGVVGDDELIRVGDSEPMPFLWDFGETLPKPEDFVLACSGTTLEDIYKASEWESQGPHLAAPMVLDRGPVQPLKGAALSAMPRNEPLDVAHSPMASAKPQRTLNRKQRKAIEAKLRKEVKSRKWIAV